MTTRFRSTTVAVLGATLALCVSPSMGGTRRGLERRPAPRVFFDDFDYSSRDALERHGWIVRSVPGWPGIPGATWRPDGVTFVSESNGNRVLRMSSATDGTAGNTSQTQICQQRKYFEGTYAARVRFSDAPDFGPAGDQLVESFYTISPLAAPMDPAYSEMDFEYLPNGGWGVDGSSLYATTWETFSPEPNWKKDNVYAIEGGSRGGWHTLVTQVGGGRVRYFVDGQLFADHGGEYYPESTMSINFNLWFIRDGAAKASGLRQYSEDIDWVLHIANAVVSPADVEASVAALRRRGIRHRDTVPSPVPALPCPCDF